jgi:hypothetical protein
MTLKPEIIPGHKSASRKSDAAEQLLALRSPRTPFLAKFRFADKLEVEVPLFYLTDQ